MTTVFILRVSYLLTYNGMITSVYIIAIFIPPNVPSIYQLLQTLYQLVYHLYDIYIDIILITNVLMVTY